ncbi:MAG TPA: hypothetical protein VFT65_10690 [Candidatus Angelobacter sp.]|nr:hypothetical protein [Candidatus Angelobacter sp.]
MRHRLATLVVCGLCCMRLNAQTQNAPANSVPTSGNNTASQQSSSSPQASPPEKLTVGGKLRYFANESFRPGVLAAAAVYTGIEMAFPPKAYPPEWRQGLAGFGRNYGDFMASWTAVQGGKFVVAAATHEDPRYIRSTRSGLLPRSLHALRFVFVDQSDSGRRRIALSNFAGAAAGGFVGSAYLPDGYNDASHAYSRSAIALSGFLTSNLADEFHPEIVKLAHKFHIPFIKK